MADPCPACNDTRKIWHDENHATGCANCCPHPEEQRYRQGEHHPRPGVETCGYCGAEFPADARV